MSRAYDGDCAVTGDVPNVELARRVVIVATPADLHRLLLSLERAGASHVRTILRLQAIKPPSAVPVG